jgi:hypothetical protein
MSTQWILSWSVLAKYESESYITTDGQLVNLSSDKAPIWGLRPDFYWDTVEGFWCGVLYLARGRECLKIVAVPRQRSHFRVRVPWDSWPYFTVSDSRLPFSSPRTTRRDMVEVIDPTSTRGKQIWELLYDWRLTANRLVLVPSPLRLRVRIFFSIEHLRSLSLYNILSDERMDLSFIIVAGSHQNIDSRVRVRWNSRQYFTVSDWRRPFLSPPTTRRVTMEVFDPNSIRDYPS